MCMHKLQKFKISVKRVRVFQEKFNTTGSLITLNNKYMPEQDET